MLLEEYRLSILQCALTTFGKVERHNEKTKWTFLFTHANVMCKCFFYPPPPTPPILPCEPHALKPEAPTAAPACGLNDLQSPGNYCGEECWCVLALTGSHEWKGTPKQLETP